MSIAKANAERSNIHVIKFMCGKKPPKQGFIQTCIITQIQYLECLRIV